MKNEKKNNENVILVLLLKVFKVKIKYYSISFKRTGNLTTKL